MPVLEEHLTVNEVLGYQLIALCARLDEFVLISMLESKTVLPDIGVLKV